MKRKLEPLPTCPVCHQTLVPVRRERVTWTKWARRWWCRRCGREHVVPETPTTE